MSRIDCGTRAPLVLLALLGALTSTSCSSKVSTSPTAGPTPRSYRMGFTGIPPTADFAVAVAAINMWLPRSDAALILHEPPWDSLLAGVPADRLVRNDPLPIANYYRAFGKPLYVNIDPTNGLNRAADSAPLVAAGRSLTEPAIRQLYRDYVVAVDTLLHPDFLGLASETNLVRAAAPPALYQALKLNAAEAEIAVRAVDAGVTLFNSVQVETAWGLLGGSGIYAGIDLDRADFPFAQALGLSSYPYFGWAEPESLPTNYYSRLTQGAPIPMFVVEGGWTSQPVLTVTSDVAKQRRYIVHHTRLLDATSAVAWFQLTFTDLALTSLPPDVATSLMPFAYLGLVDENLAAKPALSAWDSTFARPRR